MTVEWGGAQWVLATLLFVASLLPIAARAAGLSKKTTIDFIGWYAAELMQRGALVAILYWGGFWS